MSCASGALGDGRRFRTFNVIDDIVTLPECALGENQDGETRS